MPNQIQQLPDGKIEVKLETGEIFTGDPLEVTNKMADAHVNTKRWGQDFKQKYETLQAAPPVVQLPPHTEPTPDPQEAQLQNYLLEQTAKSLGYRSGEEFKADLGRVKQTTDEVQNQAMASNFLSACPDFPNTPEAIDRLGKFIDANGWDFSQQSMIAAHALCTRENAPADFAYKSLTAEEQNAQWSAGLQASNRQAPPPPPPAGAVDNRGQQLDEYSMKLDDLRKQVLAGQQSGAR